MTALKMIAAVAALGASSAIAAERLPFDVVDTDRNGAISRAEFEDIPRFARFDANDDGFVTLAEAGADTRISREFERADRNGDHRLDRREFAAALRMQ